MIRPYEAKDLERIDLSPDHREIAVKVALVMDRLGEKGLAHTLVTASDKPVAIMAAVPLPKMPGNCEVFIFPSTGRASHRVAFWKGLKTMIARAQVRFAGGVHAVSKNEPALCEFFRRLGFGAEPVNERERPECVGMRGWVFLATVTFFIDHFAGAFFSKAGVALADPVTAALVITATAAAVSTGVGVAQYEAAQGAAHAQEDLAAQQQAQLQQQQQDAAAQAAAQATTGASFGFADEHVAALATGFGNGGGSGAPNSPRQQITGMD